MKKTGKTVAYPMVPNLRFLSTSVPQGSLQGPSPSELVSDGFREDLAEGLGPSRHAGSRLRAARATLAPA